MEDCNGNYNNIYNSCVKYLVDNNNELKMDIDWSKTYGNLTSGKYRIIKRIYDGEYKYFSVEFDL